MVTQKDAKALFSKLQSEGKSEKEIHKILWDSGYTKRQIDSLFPQKEAGRVFNSNHSQHNSGYLAQSLVILGFPALIIGLFAQATAKTGWTDVIFVVFLFLSVLVLVFSISLWHFIVYKRKKHFDWDLNFGENEIVFIPTSPAKSTSKFPTSELKEIHVSRGGTYFGSNAKFVFKGGKEFIIRFQDKDEVLMRNFLEKTLRAYSLGYRKSCGQTAAHDVTIYTLTGGTVMLDDTEKGNQVKCSYCGSSSYKKNAQCWKCGKPLKDSRGPETIECPTCASLNTREETICWVCGESLKK